MTKREALNGKPYAGTPHVRFDEGEVASTATSRRGSLLYTKKESLYSGCVLLLSSLIKLYAIDLSPTIYYLKSSETSGLPGGFTNACLWATKDNVSGVGYVSAEHAYVVKNGFTLRADPNGTIFGGKSLTIGSEDGTSMGVLQHRIVSTKYEREGLILSCGRIEQTIRSGFTATPDGPVLVTASKENPFQIVVVNENGGFEFPGRFTGDESSALVVGGGNSASNTWVYLTGETDYSGGIVVTSRFENTQYAFGTLFAGKSFIEGEVTMRRGTCLRPYSSDDTFTIGTLNLDAGSQLKPVDGAEGFIVVANGLNISGKVQLAVDSTATESALLIPVMRGPAGIRIAVSSFVFLPKDRQYGMPYVEHDDSTDTDMLYIRLLPIVTLKTTDGTSKDKTGGGSAFTNRTSWSNNDIPREGFCYLVSDLKCIRSTVDDSDCYFPGDVLILDNARMTLFGNRTFYFNQLELKDGAKVWKGQGGDSPDVLLDASVLKVAGTVDFGAYTHQTNTVRASIEGSSNATIRLTGVTSTGNYNIRGYYRFIGNNADYKGKMVVTQPDLPWDTNVQRQVLLVDDSRNLGGNLDAFDFRALKMEKAGTLKPISNVTLHKESNRGVFVDGVGVFEVAKDVVLDLRTSLTLNGNAIKFGEGELKLGAPVLFYSGEKDEPMIQPIVHSNILSVAGGSLRPTVYNGIDGVTVDFSAGSRLVLELRPEDDEFMKYGILNARTSTPFVLSDGVPGLPLSVDVNAYPEMVCNRLSFGVCTVTNLSETVAATRRMMPKLKPYKGIYTWMSERVNEEGTRTFVLNIERRGTCISLR